MNHQELGKWLQRESGKTVTLPLDDMILTDAMSEDTINKIVQMTHLRTNKIITFIDHDTPNSTVEVGGCQRKLIDFSLSHGIKLENCQGAAYMRLLESYCHDGQIVVGTGRHMASLGAAGILGITVSETQLLKCLEKGELTVTIPAVSRIHVTGKLPQDVSWQDAGIALLERLNNQQGKLLALFGLENCPVEERFELFHTACWSGAWSMVLSNHEDGGEVFDLSEVKRQAVLPEQKTGTPLANLKKIPVQEVFIGGCRGGKIADLRTAAAILKGKKIAYRLRMVVAPITSAVYVQALHEGLIDIFLDSGAVVMNQGCSVCWGKAQGILDCGEVLVSTGSFNYKGCCGNKGAFVYLVSPAVAARAAVDGYVGVEA
jgi:3-isopropylmalate/(R)-2-methylmalate dehydratase large subunit